MTKALPTPVCPEPSYVAAACEMVAEMVECLQSVLALGHRRNSGMPAFLTALLRNIVVSLARLPLVNSYTRVPPLVSLLVPSLRHTECCSRAFRSRTWSRCSD